MSLVFRALMTDFTLVVPRALHRANGGYLVLDIERLLSNPYSWDLLKCACLAVRRDFVSSRSNS